MEAQRSEVTQLRSHSEQVPGPRSFFASISPPPGQIYTLRFNPDSQDTVC